MHTPRSKGGQAKGNTIFPQTFLYLGLHRMLLPTLGGSFPEITPSRKHPPKATQSCISLWIQDDLKWTNKIKHRAPVP